MEIFRFIKQQWNRLDFDDIAIAFVLAVIACSVIITWIISTIAAAIIIGIIVMVLCGLLLSVIDYTRVQWCKYRRDKDLEAHTRR